MWCAVHHRGSLKCSIFGGGVHTGIIHQWGREHKNGTIRTFRCSETCDIGRHVHTVHLVRFERCRFKRVPLFSLSEASLVSTWANLLFWRNTSLQKESGEKGEKQRKHENRDTGGRARERTRERKKVQVKKVTKLDFTNMQTWLSGGGSWGGFPVWFGVVSLSAIDKEDV